MLDFRYPREGGRGQRGRPRPAPIFLFGGFVLVGRPAVVQDFAYPFHELNPRLWSQVGIGELVRQFEEPPSFVIIQRFIIVALLSCCRRRSNLPPGGDKQPLLDTLHGRVVIVGDRLVMQPGVDHGRVEALVAQELLDRRHPAAGVQKLRRTRVTQPMGIHLDAHPLAGGLQAAADQVLMPLT
jgi:hypothetical protein